MSAQQARPPIDPVLRPFCRFTDDDIDSRAPMLQVSFEAPADIYLERNTTVSFSVQNVVPLEQLADKSRPVFFRWEHWKICSTTQMVLLRHDAGGLHSISVPPQGSLESDDSIVIDPSYAAQGIKTLEPNDTFSSCFWISANYLKAMVPGDTYTLLFPGKEVRLWNYGHPEHHFDEILKPRALGIRMIIPGGAYITFTARSDPEPRSETQGSEEMFPGFWPNGFEQT